MLAKERYVLVCEELVNMVCLRFVLLILSAGALVNGEQSPCERIASETARADRGTVVIRSADRLVGTWVSQGCETRPGPEHLLRIYTFTPEGTYHVVQHHYWDESCTSPKFTVSARGRLRLGPEAFVTAGATTAEYRPVQVNVTAHDARAAKELEGTVEEECSGYRKLWRAYEEHTVFDITNNHGHKPTNYRPRLKRRHIGRNTNYHTYITQRHLYDVPNELLCLGSIRWTFNELKLLKVQLRPEFSTAFTDGSRVNLELLLGDVHSRLEYRENYIPTAFQVPLIKSVKEVDNYVIGKRKYNLTNCQLCSIIKGQSLKTPPHLMKKPHLPPYILGEWTSMRCEIRPMGLYLTRRFRFYSGDLTWIGEHKFFVDPFCVLPKFIVTAAGHFKSSGPSTSVKGSTNFDFQIERASLTILEKDMIQEMKNNHNCGSGSWELGVPRELSSTNGCLQLGILIPSIQYEIVRIDVDFRGLTLLHLGQADTDNQPRTRFQRPTAFQDALVHCSNLPLYSENLREILNTPIYVGQGFYTTFEYLQSSANTYKNMSILLLLPILWYLR